MASFKLFLFFSFLFFFLQASEGNERYCPTGCVTEVPIRFPFQMIDSLPENRCGYDQRFTVRCQNETQNILRFPFSGDFEITSIGYPTQRISIRDPSYCTPKRLLQGFNYYDTPFQPLHTRNFTFLNCSSDAPIFQNREISPIPCLSSESNLVVALSTDSFNVYKYNMTRCTEMTTILFPEPEYDSTVPLGNNTTITLTWKEPDCVQCESMGGICQFKDDASLDIGCFKIFDPKISEKARHISLLVTASVLSIFGLLMCVLRIIKHLCQRSQPDAHEISISTNNAPQLGNVVSAKGLDRPTIEMYPTTLLDESMRLPNPADNVCPICLLDYQAKEKLRTIPSCMHYFHADCIDEWLKRNGTCPLCRN